MINGADIKVIFREEKFGGLLYNLSTSKYDYLDRENVDNALAKFAKNEIHIIKNKNISDCYLNAPVEIGIDITQNCNLSCEHCYKDSGVSLGGELSTQEIFKIIDEASEVGIFCFYISGGEATCRPDLFKIINYAHSKGINSLLTTNGVYGKEMWDKIISANLLRVQVSLDGPESIHDSIRGKGNFVKSVESIKYLNANKVSIRISCHLCEVNKESILEMVKLANSLGVGIKFSTIRPIGRQQNNSKLKMLSNLEFYKTVKKVLELKRGFPDIQITCDFDKLVAKELLLPLPTGGNNRCLAAEKTITIDSYGNIYPCSFFSPFPKFNAGNVKNNGFMEVWRNSKVIKKFRARKPSKDCEACKYFEKNCLGGCPAISYAIYKNLEVLDPTCPKSKMDC